ncbi:MAG TPA: DUF4403 family protein [Flavobacteriales bacterium]|nr:DUF4403 family protein [Flavobacteriales bacterium]
MRIIPVFFFIAIVFSACKNTVSVVKPAENYVPRTSFDKQVSVINVPVEIPVAELEKQTNKYLSGTIYEDKSFTDNGGDNLKCLVKKYSPIEIDALENRIKITLPLDISGSYTKLGATVDFKGVLSTTYVTAITFEDNWKLKTVTNSNGYKWIKSPSVNMGLFDLPVTWIADAAIKGQKDYINKTIDDCIKEYVNLKELTKPAFDALAEPINVSETYKSWFKITPIEALVTQLNAQGKKIKFALGLKANTETFIGEKPAIADLSKGVPMKAVKELPKDFNIGLVAVTPYADASAILDEQFVKSGYEYKEGKYHLKFTKMNLYGQNEKMVIEVGMLGSVNGDIYLVGTPYYDQTSRSIKMKDLDFDIDSKQKLIKAANWLAHGKLCKIMQESMVFPIGEQLDLAKKDAQSYFTNYSPMKGITINGKLEKLETSDVYLIQNAIVTLINVGGNMHVKLQGLD